MIKKTRMGSSSLFLLELIIALLFFAVSSSICIQIFAKSHSIIEESNDLDFAVGQLSSIGEVCQTSDTIDDTITNLQLLYPHMSHLQYNKHIIIPDQFFDGLNTNDIIGLEESSADIIAIYYDKDGFTCHKSDGSYAILIVISEKDNLITYNMAAFALLIDNSQIIIDEKINISEGESEEAILPPINTNEQVELIPTEDYRLIYKLEVKHNEQNIR